MLQKVAINLRIVCTNPPADTCNGYSTEFGLQDKSGKLLPGQPVAENALMFACALTASPTEPPNFTGAYAHGTPKDRFLYLSYRFIEGPQTGEWIKRIKVPLNTILWEQVETVANGVLEATVDGGRAARVRVEWVLIP
ncbi:MAG: hypothetical protein CL610_12090 [Anaerolineaceae bacterium]|nr:hypothetical protein [Anaerolineaceae bacterium]